MSLIESINIGESGLKAHGQRLEIHAKNIANIDTPNYVRKIPVVLSKDDVSFQGMLHRMKENVFKTGVLPVEYGGVTVTGAVEDPTKGDLVYKPGHPDADTNGFIRTSNVNPLIDMADANMSSHAYEASLAVITIAKTMAQKASNIGK